MGPKDFEQARSAQDRLLRTIGAVEGVKGVGIGVTRARDSYALEVLVENATIGVNIPNEVDGIPVVCTVVTVVDAL